MAMILSMSVTSIFAVQAAEEMLAVSSEETVIMLHSPHQGTYSEDFNNKPDENGGLEDPVVWHFVLNQLNHGQEALMIEAEFEDAGIISVEGRSVGNGSVQHFFIGTSIHDTLINAFVVIQGESGGMLVLSHVAFGEVEEEEALKRKTKKKSMMMKKRKLMTKSRMMKSRMTKSRMTKNSKRKKY